MTGSSNARVIAANDAAGAHPIVRRTYAWPVFIDFMRDKAKTLPVDGVARTATAVRI